MKANQLCVLGQVSYYLSLSDTPLSHLNERVQWMIQLGHYYQASAESVRDLEQVKSLLWKAPFSHFFKDRCLGAASLGKAVKSL